MHPNTVRRSFPLRRTALVAALAMGLGGVVHAQSTTGTIFGQAPAAANETVTVSGSTGITRQVPVDAAGRYRVGNLPLGSYNVSLEKDGAVVDTRKNVDIVVGQGTEHGLQVHVTVADVERQRSVRFQSAQIELQGLTRQKMNGDGVGAERVHDQQVVLG